jgi:hypothetical protein
VRLTLYICLTGLALGIERVELTDHVASDPDTTVPILPITFEPFDRPRRQIVGSHSPGD